MEKGTWRVWLLNYGLHLLGSYPNKAVALGEDGASAPGVRSLNPRLAHYRADMANSTHALLRRALAATGDAYERTVLVWRNVNFVCASGLYGDWDAAAKVLAASPRSPSAAGEELCARMAAAEWTRGPRPAFGEVGLREACRHATFDAHGSEFLNDMAAETIRQLNECYLDETPEDQSRARLDVSQRVPCPDDLRGIYARRPEWRLPGVHVLSGNHIGAALCGRVGGDGVHSPQLYLPMTRALLGALHNAG